MGVLGEKKKKKEKISIWAQIWARGTEKRAKSLRSIKSDRLYIMTSKFQQMYLEAVFRDRHGFFSPMSIVAKIWSQI